MHKYVRDKQDITARWWRTRKVWTTSQRYKYSPLFFQQPPTAPDTAALLLPPPPSHQQPCITAFATIYPCHQQRRRRIRIRRRQRDCQRDCQGQRRRRQTRTSASTHLSDGDVAQALQALGHVRVPRLEPGRANFERAEVLGPRLLQLAALEPEVPQRRAVKRVL